MKVRGYVLPIVLAMIGVLTLLGMIIQDQLLHQRVEERIEEHRWQALWLARSAAAAEKPLVRDVQTDAGLAHLTVKHEGSKWVAEARIDRFGAARVVRDGASTTETYDRSP